MSVLHLQARGLFEKLSVPAKVIELDAVQGGEDLQLGLQEVTGLRTVPQVFIGGSFLGGCDGEMAALCWLSHTLHCQLCVTSWHWPGL